MTRFELARLTGLFLLEEGSQEGDSRGSHTAIKEVAHRIIDKGVDAVIRRPLADGGYEDVHVEHLERSHLRVLL